MDPERLGPYRIVGKLGRGGMGTVYHGIHDETGEAAALKILSSSFSDEEGMRQRFEAEIEALRKLRHPNIVRLTGFGEQDGTLFFAMELVEGRTLEQEIRAGRRFDWREATRIAIDMCRALRHAHDRGIVHRDIKPANLLLASDGTVKLSDFGIARLFGYSRLTADGNIIGTLDYMSPEQGDARPVGPKSDLYSLGGVLYAILAGRPPFRGRSPTEMLQKHREAQPEPVRCFAPGTPEELDRIVLELLAKSPDDRPANAMLLGRRLEAMLHALAGASSTITPGADAPSTFDATIERPSQAPIAVTPTRIAESATGLPVTVANTVPAAPAEQPPAAASGSIAETRATAAFQVYGGPPAGTDPGEYAVAVEEEKPPAAQFTIVPEEDLDRIESRSDERALISLHTWVLAAALVAMGLTIWYMLQPPTADALYARITAQAAGRSISALRDARPDITEFLVRYSDDPRAAQLQQYMDELELADLERQFELRAGGSVSDDRLSPVERAYLEAIRYAEVDPERQRKRLAALVDLYGTHAGKSGPTGRCLELARRRLEKLQTQAEQIAPDQIALVTERLDAADALPAAEAAEARRIRQAVIELYGGQPWAADLVRRAQEALE